MIGQVHGYCCLLMVIVAQSDLDTVECTNCYVQISNAAAEVDTSLEISDITVVYRPKKTFGRVT